MMNEQIVASARPRVPARIQKERMGTLPMKMKSSQLFASIAPARGLLSRDISGKIEERNVAAIVVLYHPDYRLLERLLCSVVDQVNRILVIDNTPNPDSEISRLLKNFEERVSYFPLGDNMGIATAQNIGIRASVSEGYSHVLLLDQDSALPPKMVERLLAGEAALLSGGKEVAAVGPQFIDEKSGRPSPAIRHHYFRIQKLYLDPNSSEPFETDHLIASGSIMRTSVLQRIGPMRDDLFIDWVDIEWCMRARSMGYKSYYIPSVVMKHSVGDSVVTISGRDLHLHNDIRNYYMLRNAIYLFRLKSMGWRWKINFAPRVPCYLVLYPFLSNSKLKNSKIILRAIWDGILGRLGRLAEK
jgi:rhamnosyltransferase